MKEDLQARAEHVEQLLRTLYTRTARGYSLSDKVLESDAIKNIEGEIDKLHKSSRKVIADMDAYRRLEIGKRFHESPESVKVSVRKLMREKGLEAEAAYEEVAKPSKK